MADKIVDASHLKYMLDEMSEPTPEPTPVPTPDDPIVDASHLRYMLGEMAPAPEAEVADEKTDPLWSVLRQRMPHLSDKETRKFVQQIRAKAKDNQKVIEQIDNPTKKGGYSSDPEDLGKYKDLLPGFANVEAITDTAARAFTSASTEPSRVVTEAQAIRMKEGQDSPSVTAMLGSTVRLAKSLNPFSDGETFESARKGFSAFDKENAKNFVRRVYNTPVIDPYGNVNKEALDYSGLPRYIQNELSINWAMDRTGIGSREFFENIISARSGVLERDSPFEAGMKRVVQPLDAMLGNAPTWLYKRYATPINSQIDAVKASKYPNVARGDAQLAKQPKIVKGNDDQWYAVLPSPVDPQTGKPRDPEYVLIEKFNPNADKAEQLRQARAAVIDDTVNKMEYQAFEPWAQVIDPTIFIGAGMVKKVAQGALGAGRIARAAATGARAIESVLPFADNAGAATALAKGVATSNTAQRFLPPVSAGARAVVAVSRSDTALGTAVRSVDKTLTAMALYSGLNAVGAPEGSKKDAAITSALMMVGMSPLHVMASAKPYQGIFDSANKNIAKEIILKKDPATLSNYSKKFVEKEMNLKGMTDYNQYRDDLIHNTEGGDMVDLYAKVIQETSVTSDMITELGITLARRKDFQDYADALSRLRSNRGVTVYGLHGLSAIEKVRRQAEDNAKNIANQTSSIPGTASMPPQAVINSHMIAALSELKDAIPPGVLNSQDEMMKWLDGEISGQRGNYPPGMQISPDVALAIKGQLTAIPIEKIYEPYSTMAIIVNAAMDTRAKELGQTVGKMTKAGGLSDAFAAFGELHDHYQSLPKEDLAMMLSDLSAFSRGTSSKESAIDVAVRRMNKPEQNDISPAAAAREIEQDILDKMRGLPELIKELEFHRRLALPTNKSAGSRALSAKRVAEIEQEISDTRKSTHLYGFLNWARDTQKNVVDMKSKIKAELEKGAGLDEAKSATNVAAGQLKKAKRERDLLLEVSRLRAERNVDTLEEAKVRTLHKITIAKTSRELKAIAASTNAAKHGFPAKRVKDILMKNVQGRLPGGMPDETKALIGKARQESSRIKELERHAKVLQQTIDDHPNTVAKVTQFTNNLSIANVPHGQSHSVGGAWFDEEMSGAIHSGIDQLPYFQNLRTAILDDIEASRTDMKNYLSTGGTGNFITNIPPEHIAAVRLLADEDWVNAVGGNTKSPTYRFLKTQATKLADHLALVSSQSQIARAAIESLDDSMKNPMNSSINKLMQQYKVLTDSVFVQQIMDDAKKPAASGGIFARIEEMVNRDSNGLLSYKDFVFLQDLTKDSAIGKGYRAHLESIGQDAPWMITYRHDVGNFMDAISSMSGDVVTKALDDTRAFFHDSGSLYDPTELDIRIAAGLILSVGNSEGVRSRLVDLLGIARQWHDKTWNLGEQLQTTENLALSLDRQLGKNATHWLNQIFDAANKANNSKMKYARPFIDSLEKLKVGNETYMSHMRPNSPVRNMLVKSTVAVNGHDAIPTENIKYAKSGYWEGLNEGPGLSSEIKSGMTPEEVAAKGRKNTIYITDHVLVNGQLTAFGRVLEEFIKERGQKTSREFVEEVIAPRFGAQADDSLKNFLVQRIDWWAGKKNDAIITPNQFDLFTTALQLIQNFDRNTLKVANEENQLMNKRFGTNFADIRYEPWRLEQDVPTDAGDILLLDPTLLGSYKDADRLMGSKYSTTPENQIAKAQHTKLTTDNILYGPEEVAINRLVKLVNDAHSRTPRANLAHTAEMMEFEGYNKQAQILRNFVIAPSTGVDRTAPVWSSLARAVEQGDQTGALYSLSLVARTLWSPYVILASPVATILEQPAQQGILQFSNRPTLFGLARTAMVVGSGVYGGVKRALPLVGQEPLGALFGSLFIPTNKLNTKLGGESLKLKGPYAKANMDIYDGLSKRSDPYLESRIAEARRNPGWLGDFGKKLSRAGSTWALVPEATATRMLFLWKEASENASSVRLLQQSGAIFQTGMKEYEKGGRAAFQKHMSDFMVGTTANNSLLTSISRMVDDGLEEEAYRAFATWNVKANLGNWNNSNIPKFLRQAARLVPNADSYAMSGILGASRAVASITNMHGLTSKQKAYGIASALSIVAISVGLGYVSQETGISWFDRLSPARQFKILGSLATGNFSKKDLPDAIAGLSNGSFIKMGPTQVGQYRAIMSFLDVMRVVSSASDASVKGEDRDGALEKAKDKFLKIVLDNSPARLASGLVNEKPSDLLSFYDHIGDGLNVGMDPDDVENLKRSRDAVIKYAADLKKKKTIIEQETGVKVNTAAEEFGLYAMSLFCEISLQAQEEFWAAHGHGTEGGLPGPFGEGASREQKIIVQGKEGRSPWAVKYLNLLEQGLKRYEAENKLHDTLTTGRVTDLTPPATPPSNVP